MTVAQLPDTNAAAAWRSHNSQMLYLYTLRVCAQNEARLGVIMARLGVIMAAAVYPSWRDSLRAAGQKHIWDSLGKAVPIDPVSGLDETGYRPFTHTCSMAEHLEAVLCGGDEDYNNYADTFFLVYGTSVSEAVDSPARPPQLQVLSLAAGSSAVAAGSPTGAAAGRMDAPPPAPMSSDAHIRDQVRQVVAGELPHVPASAPRRASRVGFIQALPLLAGVAAMGLALAFALSRLTR